MARYLAAKKTESKQVAQKKDAAAKKVQTLNLSYRMIPNLEYCLTEGRKGRKKARKEEEQGR